MKTSKTTKKEKQEDKMFVPNFSKKKFKIEIIVYENCQTMQVINLEENVQPTFQEVVGAITITTQNFMNEQMTINQKEYNKINRNESKL